MHRSRLKKVAWIGGGVVLLYLFVAYLTLPELWWFHDRRHIDVPGGFVTRTPDGIAGDPINIGLIGTRNEVMTAFSAAGWSPADKITFDSSIGIGLSVVFDEPDADAPVSTLLYDGRPQDLAFENRVGRSADQRNHVRFWLMGPSAQGEPPLWLGSASFDRGVGISHDTGQITHHIGPDVDAERDRVVTDLTAAGKVADVTEEDGIGPTTDGRNGGGDRYFTDGMIRIVTLRTEP
jgi:hypothetical protein